MSVHYKFKSTLDYDTITFDGLHISVADLKKAILQQKRLSKITDFDLQIINAQTKEEYQHDTSLIPKNTSLIISRVPVANQTKKSWEASTRTVQARIPSKVESADFDLSKMEGSEEDKIQAMMLQSTAEYDPKSYQKIRGYSQTGEVPATYRCNKCKKGGHWIKNCPYTISKEHTVEKRTTGIPKSFRDKDDRAMMIESQETIADEDKKQEIPEDLLCNICNDLFVDAVMIPCCGSSFCDDCVRNALLDSEDNECPDCKEKGSSPGSLIPNRFLRNSVNAFKNRTGYKASSQTKRELFLEANQTPKEVSEVKNNEEKEKELDLPETESIEVEKGQEEKKTNDLTQKNEETHMKISTSNVVASEISEDIKIENDDLKHKTANMSNSPAHEDSDYEDNIVVTVPSASDTRTEKYLHRRHSSHPKPPGIEQNSPKSKNQISPYHQDGNSHRLSESSSHVSKEWEHNSLEKVRDYHENNNSTEQYKYDKGRTIQPAKPVENLQPPGANTVPVPLYPPHQSYDIQQQRPIRPMNMHTGFHNHMHRPPLYPHPNMPPHHPPHQMRLPMPTLNTYDPSYNAIGNVAPGYQRFPSAMPNRFNYPIREAEHQNQMRPFNNIASVYEEVAAKVGVGIIDDPLEAFNRIMKEKEKKKDERRSPDRRRRSKDRHTRGNFRLSPFNSRLKDHGYHDKRGRSRDRDNERRWARYGKTNEKERERERERERDREHDREKNSGYRPRRSKSIERSSRSRTHSPPPNKRYRSSPSTNAHIPHEKHPHHYHQKFRLDEPEDVFDRQKRDQGRTLGNSLKSLDTKAAGIRQHMDNEEKNTEVRKPYNINDENSEPPPPGFEMHTTRNPFHTNNVTFTPSSANRDRDRPGRNNTPDLYEKCVSQDMEENKFYHITGKSDQRFESRSQTRSRSRSRSSLRISEKRRKIHRSTTPKGKPSENHNKREKDILSSRSHLHGKRRSEERHSKKDKDFIEHELKRRSMTPPRQKDVISEHNQTSSETDQKDKSENKKSEKKLKDRKKKRREKSERKKVKKEKKSKKERHRLKSEDNNYTSKDCGNDDPNQSTSNMIGPENENKSGKVLIKNENPEEGPYSSTEKLLSSNSTPKIERNDSATIVQNVSTPKQQHQSIECDEKNTTPSDIKSFDAVLDIHEYETDFDDHNFKLQENTTKFVPKASKWELEDQLNTFSQCTEGIAEENKEQNNSDSKITNDVIVRAEKAIFARAINAIRPSEVCRKSTSKEKSLKCYSDDHENIRNIQITLPVNISTERSIEVKNDTSNNEKKKSIKDRLGSKISQPLYSQVGETRKESEHSYKPTYATNDREAATDRERRTKSGINTKINNNKRIETEKSNRLEKIRDRSHEKDRSRDKDKERYVDKERSRHRERDNLDKGKEKERDNEKNREKLRDHRHGHHSEGERKNFYNKSGDHKISKVEKSHHSSDRERREHDSLSRKRHHSNSSPVSQRKRSPSLSNSNSDDEDRKRKHAKGDKKSRKHSDTPESDSGKKSIKKKNKSDKKKKKKSKK